MPMDVRSFLLSAAGRATRRDFWMLSLGVTAGTVLFAVVGNATDLPLLAGIWILLTIVPSIMVQVRRCHDRGRSGWFILCTLIPAVGPIWVLVELGFLRGTDGPNRFGPDPLVPERDGLLAT